MRFAIFLLKLNNSNKVFYIRFELLFLEQSLKSENQEKPKEILSILEKRPRIFNSRYSRKVHLIGYIELISKTQTDYSNKG